MFHKLISYCNNTSIAAMSFENVRGRGTIELIGVEVFFSIFVAFTIFLQFYGVCIEDQYCRTFDSTSDTIVIKISFVLDFD